MRHGSHLAPPVRFEEFLRKRIVTMMNPHWCAALPALRIMETTSTALRSTLCGWRMNVPRHHGGGFE